MPKIAYISSTFPNYEKCGTGIYAGYLCQALAQQGHEVHVVTTAIPEIVPVLGKVNVHKIMQTWNPLDIPRLMQFLMQTRPDIIHINHPTAIAAQKSKFLINFIPELNRVTTRIPLVTTIHEFGRVSILGKLKILPLLYASDALTVTTRRYAEHVKKYLPENQHHKINIVNIGSAFRGDLPEGDRRAERMRWDLTDDDKVLGFVGFITPPKGFHNLIEAVAPLMREDRKIKLLALSSWNQSTSAYRQKILDMIEAAGITSQVIFTGYLKDDELWAALTAVDTIVFPFDYPVEDRSSAPLRQVLFRGTPTITYAEDISYEEFGMKHGENIWFTPFKNAEALRRDVLTLLRDRELRDRLSAGARALRPQLNYDAISNEMSRIYAKLIASR